MQSYKNIQKEVLQNITNEHLSERRLAMNSELRNIADNIIDAAIKAVLPDAAVKRALDGKEFKGKVILVSVGKLHGRWQWLQVIVWEIE